MNKILYIIIGAAILMGCSKDTDATYDEMVDIKFGINNELQAETRAGGSISNINWDSYDMRYIMEVWSLDGQSRVLRKEIILDNGSSNTTVFELRLIKGIYDFLFWTDIIPENSTADNHYITSSGLQSVQIADTYSGSDASRDAFSSVERNVEIDKSKPLLSTTLFRPFVQLIVQAKTDFTSSKSVSIKYDRLFDTYNVKTGKTSSSGRFSSSIYFPNTVANSSTVLSDFLFVPDNNKIDFSLSVGNAPMINIDNLEVEINKKSIIISDTFNP